MRFAFIGDTHGDFRKLNRLLLSLKEVDIAIQVGDFGYFPHIPAYSSYFNMSNIPLYWIEGNHEDHDSLRLGNTTHEATHLTRGTKKWGMLFMGGGTSIDKASRIPGFDWFAGENINMVELHTALENQASITIAHDTIAENYPLFTGRSTQDHNATALSVIYHAHEPSLYIHGHHHKRMTYDYMGTRFESLGTLSNYDNVQDMIKNCVYFLELL